jgi:hypothetical protein
MFAANGGTFVWPSPVRLYQLLISPARGLFVTSPILILAIPEGRRLLGRAGAGLSREAWLALGVAAAFVILNACFSGWHGGSAAGPRYLLPVYPFLFLLAAGAIRSFPRAFRVLGAVSVLINFAITAVGNELPFQIFGFPVGYALSALFTANIPVNSAPVPWSHWMDGFPSMEAASDTWARTITYHSFNLGQILLPPNFVSLLPILLFWGVAGYLELSRRPAIPLSVE